MLSKIISNLGIYPAVSNDMKILIVDDNSGTLNALRIGLTSFGFHVITASSGVQALGILVETIQDNKGPDLLLTDLKMPGMSGMELIHMAREIHADLPVILMTGFGDKTIRREFRNLERFAYLEKPFVPEELVNIIYQLKTLEHSEKSATDVVGH